MSIEEAIRRLVDVAKTLKPDSRTYIAFRMAVEALWAQERQEDDGKYLIDRQAAIDAFTHKWDGMVTSVFDVINSLPSAQPEPYRGGAHED